MALGLVGMRTLSSSSLAGIPWDTSSKQLSDVLLHWLPSVKVEHKCRLLNKLSEACSIAERELWRQETLVSHLQADDADPRQQYVLESAVDRYPMNVRSHIAAFARLDQSEDYCDLKCVSKQWRDALQTLGLQRRINRRLLAKDARMPMSQLIKLLEGDGRAHFANLDYLRMPSGSSFGKRCAVLAKLCPKLSRLDLGYMYLGAAPKHDELSAVALGIQSGGLSRLTNLRFSLRNLAKPDETVGFVVRKLGRQLRDLRMEGGWLPEAYISDAALANIGKCCPCLASFAIHYDGYAYDDTFDALSAAGVQSLVSACSKLAELELGMTRKVGIAAFEFIADRLDRGTLALRRLQTYGINSLYSKTGVAVQKRLMNTLDVFAKSEEAYRKLLMSDGAHRSSIFLPSID